MDNLITILIIGLLIYAIYFLIKIYKLKNESKELKREYIEKGGQIKEVTYKTIGRLAYFLFSLLLIILSFSLAFITINVNQLTVFALFIYVIDYHITKMRIRDTHLNYKWRFLWFLPALFLILKLYLFFKKSKKQ